MGRSEEAVDAVCEYSSAVRSAAVVFWVEFSSSNVRCMAIPQFRHNEAGPCLTTVCYGLYNTDMMTLSETKRQLVSLIWGEWETRRYVTSYPRFTAVPKQPERSWSRYSTCKMYECVEIE